MVVVATGEVVVVVMVGIIVLLPRLPQQIGMEISVREGGRVGGY